MGTDPHAVSYMDRRRVITAPVLRLLPVIDRGKYYIRTDQYIIPYIYASVILEMASAVDKYILSDIDIFPAFRIKRRKHGK